MMKVLCPFSIGQMIQESYIPQKFSKAERLCSKKEIEFLFFEGREHSFISYPLRVVYRLQSQEQTKSGVECQILISITKKYFRRANKRNRIKRLIREAYRLNKSPWIRRLRAEQKSIQIAFMIVSKDLPDYTTIESAILKTFRKIGEKEFQTEIPK